MTAERDLFPKYLDNHTQVLFVEICKILCLLMNLKMQIKHEAQNIARFSQDLFHHSFKSDDTAIISVQIMTAV